MSDAQEVAHASVTYATCLTAILAWDWLNYLPSEYKYLWGPLFRGDAHKRRRSLGEKALAYVSCGLFLVVRYFALLEFALFTWSINATVSHEQCQKFQAIFPYLSNLVALAANAIMALRVVALYERDRNLSIFLSVSLATVAGVTLWGSSFTEAQEGIPSCIPNATSRNFNALYISVACYDAVLVAFTIGRYFFLRRKTGGTLGHLTTVIIRDGLLYFVFVFSANLLAAAFELQNAKPLLKPVNASLATVMTSIFCSRIFFNLCKAGSSTLSRGMPAQGDSSHELGVTFTQRRDVHVSSSDEDVESGMKV
ncbi:hypothetical protein FA10DRAFT_198613 [Acaromyces ingoldii]|uniref:Uncharacterized protein n=1 Tax=Acaromyces ingoldii TaxID=215250 RepID=A0A316YDH4_9BASI|nr:hypothetical protein FA10DRAFT_198613 [Acaromyces ingoldii]PWN87252.1 hypothetical protein FA10DRAFT_198613 [Acaromyces ingoldii]